MRKPKNQISFKSDCKYWSGKCPKCNMTNQVINVSSSTTFVFDTCKHYSGLYLNKKTKDFDYIQFNQH